MSTNLNEINDKLIEKFKNNGWFNILKTFLLSEDFSNIFIKLEDEVKYNKRFTPPLKNIFTAFDECEYDKLKVVFIGSHPFTSIDESNGLLFGSNNPNKKYNQIVLNSANKTYKKYNSFDYRTWANQGVLLLNNPLTTQIDLYNSHNKLWMPFITFLIDVLKNKELVWIFMGQESIKLNDLLNSKYKLNCTNPMMALYNNTEWENNNLFEKINTNLTELKKEIIVW